MLLHHVGGFTQDAAITSRLCQVLIATPEDITQLVVRQRNAVEVVEPNLMKHPQEQLLDFPPPACIQVFKIGFFCQRSKMFFRGKPGVPTILLRQLHNLSAHIHVGIIVHIIQEGIKMLSKELTQSVVCHGLMK